MTDMQAIPIADRKRFALCYIKTANKQAVDFAAASGAFDPKVKLASFKTVTARAIKKYEESNKEEELTDSDMNRFALCFMHITSPSAIDWNAAAAAYDPKVKVESFKTVTNRALRKHGVVKSPQENASIAAAGKPSAKGASSKRKRSGKDNEENSDGVEPAVTPVKGPRKKLKTLMKKTSEEKLTDAAVKSDFFAGLDSD